MTQGGISWTQLTTVDLFTSNNSLVTGKIYPGVEGRYTFKVYNPNDYTVAFAMRLQEEEHTAGSIPLEYKLKLTDGAYLAGSLTTWLTPQQLGQVLAELPAGQEISYTLQWRWPYESGKDALDTAIGSDADPEHRIKITIQAEQKV